MMKYRIKRIYKSIFLKTETRLVHKMTEKKKMEQLIKMIPFPYKTIYTSLLSAIPLHILAHTFPLWIQNEWIHWVVISILFAIPLYFAVDGETMEYVALESVEKGILTVEQNVRKSKIMIYFKNTLLVAIICIPFIRTDLSSALRIVLYIISLLATWHMFFKAYAGAFRCQYILNVIGSIIEDLERENQNKTIH